MATIQRETDYRIYTFWCSATFHDGKTTSLVKGSVTSSNEQCAFMLFEDRLKNLGKKSKKPAAFMTRSNTNGTLGSSRHWSGSVYGGNSPSSELGNQYP